MKKGREELTDQHLRLRAEYDNFRKRTIKEREAAYSDTVCDVVASFLPVYDNLERAVKTPTGDAAFLKGVEMTLRQFSQCLEKLGVSEVPAEGQPFDPNQHNAVMHVEDENLGQNVVAEVFQKGFQIGDKIIRHAMVKVAN
jgi:molecular chaperone GrpE